MKTAGTVAAFRYEKNILYFAEAVDTTGKFDGCASGNFYGQYDYVSVDNPPRFDKEKFIERSLSGSYSLKAGDRGYKEYMDALTALFDLRRAASRQGLLSSVCQTV